MTFRPFPVLALLALLYFGPGLFLFTMARGADLDESLSWTAVVSPEGEPGEPLHVSGRVYAPDGTTPVAGVELYVYHTDTNGYYAPGTTDNSNPRLKATLETDAEGRYEYRTIKPGPYPDGGVPAHVHYVVGGAGYPEQRHDLHFEGDRYLSQRTVERSRAAGRFGTIRPFAADEEGVLQVTFDIRLRR